METGKRPDWPETPSGTTDWEQVFEDPRRGLIPMISQAKSPAALRDSTVLAIGMLHTRKDDPEEVGKFTAEIKRLIPDDTSTDLLPQLLEAVTIILRKVKEERKRKAAEYAEEQKKQKSTPRAKTAITAKKINRRERDKVLAQAKRRRTIMWGSVAAVLLVGAGIGAYFTSGRSIVEKKLEPNNQLMEQMRIAAAEQWPEPRPNIFGGLTRVETQGGRIAVTATGLPQDVCFSVSWVLINRGTVVVNGLISQRMSPTIIQDLCSRNIPGSITWLPKK